MSGRSRVRVPWEAHKVVRHPKIFLYVIQAYIDNIRAKTGLGPEDFKKLATQKGFLRNGKMNADVKAGEIVKWLKEDFNLGHGHSMAIYALFKGIKK